MHKVIFIISICLHFWACNSDKKSDFKLPTSKNTSANNQKHDLIREETRLLTDNKLVITGSDGTIDTMFRFNSKLKNKKYNVTSFYKIRPKQLNFTTYKYGRLYKTATINDVKENGANFAGHYTLAKWGCGSACHMSAIVDLKTGNVFIGPDACYGYKFDITSRIIQINPPDSSEWYYSNRLCGPPQEYLWDGKKLALLAK